jgi:hypothetical protein
MLAGRVPKKFVACSGRVHEVERNCPRHWTFLLWAILPGTGGVTMKRVLMAATVLAVFASTQALAQTVGVGPAGTVIVEPEQRTVIKDYVVKERVAPVRVKERIAVGATLPADVELRAVPSAWGPKLSKYRYIYSDDHVYLVEPSNRTVVHIID